MPLGGSRRLVLATFDPALFSGEDCRVLAEDFARTEEAEERIEEAGRSDSATAPA